MAKTSVDLAIEVLEELKIVGAGETPDSADSAKVIDRYNLILQELETLGLAAWDPDVIPERFYLPLVGYVTSRCARLFGSDDYVDDLGALTMLKRAVAKPYMGKDYEISYF